MTKIKRIEASKVVEAYESTGIRPAFGEWLDKDSNCACGLGVVLASEKGMDEAVELIRDADNSFRDIFGLESWYITGFVSAFDGEKAPYAYSSPEIKIPYDIGFEDGANSRNAVLEKYPNLLLPKGE